MKQYSGFFGVFVAVLLLDMAGATYAQTNAQEDNTMVVLDCKVTPNIAPDYIPMDRPETSNNLRRKEGAGIVANGVYTEIRGKVLDRFCVPVANALIYLWQTDKAGNYKEHYQRFSEWDMIDENYDENFAYSGTARTDNRGEFAFLTIFPGGYEDRAPHLNMKVVHRDFEDLNTQIFFAHHPRNQQDPVLNRLTPDKRELLLLSGEPLDAAYKLQGRRYELTITLDGENRFQRY